MKDINRHLYALIEQACKIEGTYDPDRLLPHFEESLTVGEARTLTKFLDWCHKANKPFGHGNYNQRFAEWRKHETDIHRDTA